MRIKTKYSYIFVHPSFYRPELYSIKSQVPKFRLVPKFPSCPCCCSFHCSNRCCCCFKLQPQKAFGMTGQISLDDSPASNLLLESEEHWPLCPLSDLSTWMVNHLDIGVGVGGSVGDVGGDLVRARDDIQKSQDLPFSNSLQFVFGEMVRKCLKRSFWFMVKCDPHGLLICPKYAKAHSLSRTICSLVLSPTCPLSRMQIPITS